MVTDVLDRLMVAMAGKPKDHESWDESMGGVADLFNEKKSYLLIGGIGSLGLQIALWMYEVRSK